MCALKVTCALSASALPLVDKGGSNLEGQHAVLVLEHHRALETRRRVKVRYYKHYPLTYTHSLTHLLYLTHSFNRSLTLTHSFNHSISLLTQIK